MKQKSRFFLVLIGIVIVAAGGGILNTKILVLQLQNTDHPHIMSVRIKPMERFSIYYVHSVHQKPVIEDFEAAPNMIILKGMRTTSLAIMEQYGFEDPKSFQPMNEKLGAIFFRVAEGEGQGLIVRDRKIYLSEVGARGDRIQLSARSISLGSYLFGG